MAGAARGQGLGFEFFGGPALWRNGRRVAISPAQSGLLSVGLGDGRTRVPKTLVQRVLWGEANSRAVRHRASQLVYQTNQRCGARVLATEGEFVRVRWDVVACDLAAFWEMLAKQRFAAACDLLERGFLPAFPRWKEEALADWIERRRVGVRTRLRSASLAGWHAAEAAQDWAAARRASQVLLRIDPQDELMLRRVMRAQAMGGRVREAEAVYRAFADQTRDWSPHPETRRLLRSVQARGTAVAGGRRDGLSGRAARAESSRGTGEFWPERGTPSGERGDARRGAPDGPAPRDAGTPEDVPFRGRDDALRRLNRALYGAGGGIATISGESGIGKTRLAEVAVLGAGVLGVGVVRARPEEADRQMRLSTLAAALGEPWIVEAVARGELPRLPFSTESLPSGAERTPGSARTMAGVAAREAVEGIRRWFHALAQSRRVLLFVDDFHWADEESALILRSICETRAAPVGLLLTYREEALRRGSAAVRCLRSLEAAARATRIRLPGLDEQASRRVAAAARRTARGANREGEAGRSAETARVAAAVRLAGGNPRFLIELARRPGVEGCEGEAGEEGARLRAPPAVRRFAHDRLDAAGEVGRKVAAGLAAFAEPASPGQVARLADCSLGEGVEAVECLEEAGLLELGGQRADLRVSFRHGIVRQAVYEATTAARRVLAHGVAAELLLSGPPGAIRRDRVARHLHLAGDRAGARKHALLAVQAAPATDVAARLSLLFVARDASDGPERQALSARLAGEHWAALRTRRALELGQEALREAGQADGPARADGPAQTAPPLQRDEEALRGAGRADGPAQGDGPDRAAGPGQAAPPPQRHEEAAGEVGQPAEAASGEVLEVQLLVTRARRELGLLSADAALKALRSIEAGALRDGREHLLVRVLDAQLTVLAGRDDGMAAGKLLDRCVALARRLRSERARRRCLATLAAGGPHGRPGDPLQAGREALSLAQSSREPDRLLLTTRGVATLAASSLLETPEGRRAVTQAKALAAESGDLRSRAALALELAEWKIRSGDHRAGETALSEARALMAPPAHCPPFERRRLLAEAGLALARCDLAKTGEAVAELRVLADGQPAEGRCERAVASAEGDLLLQLGKAGRAAELAARHPPVSAATPPLGLFLLHARLRARAQRVPEAVSLLERGLEELGEQRGLPWLRVALELVRLSRRAGAPRRALAVAAQARAQELGLAALAQEFGPFAR